MAHFAKINSSNIVEQVYVVNDSECLDGEGNESEAVGVAFLEGLFGAGTYLQTSYNTWSGKHWDADGNEDSGTPLRKNYASVGDIWDATNEGFHEPQPFNSWTLDTNSLQWEAPIPFPKNDGTQYYWDEDAYQADNSTGWVES